MIPFIFTDNTKCRQSIKSSNNVAKVQDDNNSLSTWSITTNLLLFNKSKFVHLCFWQKPTSNSSIHIVNNKSINTLTQHRDLGILKFTNDLHWPE